jgi:protein ImuA
MSTGTIPHFPLRRKRAHEVCGPGARFFAIAQCASVEGTVLWVRESWQHDVLNPTGFSAMIDPDRLILANAADQADGLAISEEALRSGAVPLVVIELSRPLSFTAGRRLQLAAKTGKSTALILIPEGMGNNAAETRWRCAPIFDAADSTLQRWEIIKNKSGTFGVWNVRWNAQTRRLIVVPPVGERPGAQGAPG